MSLNELKRAGVLARVAAETLTLGGAAALMAVSYRQAKRLYRRYRAEGAGGLKHRSAGRASNRATARKGQERVLALVRQKYGGTVDERFGPTLAAEHLGTEDGVTVDHETLRRWMLAAGLWSRARKRSPHRRRRERKAHFGELVQMDGSFHLWFEDRAPASCLLTLVDDATGTSLGRLGAQETIWGAVGVLRAWIERYGIPQALYTDWKNVYVRVANAEERATGAEPLTQFGRMCATLGIKIIPASSPQAKGRIERNHGTQQDRLVKKLAAKASRTSRRRMCFSRPHTGRTTTNASRRRPRRPTTFMWRGPAVCDSIWCFGWKRTAPSQTTGWCAMTAASFNSNARAAALRRAAPSWCRRRSTARSRSGIAPRSCGGPRSCRQPGTMRRQRPLAPGRPLEPARRGSGLGRRPITRGGMRWRTIMRRVNWRRTDGPGQPSSREEPVEAAGAVDAKSARPPLLGKLQNSFPRASTGRSFSFLFRKGTFLTS